MRPYKMTWSIYIAVSRLLMHKSGLRDVQILPEDCSILSDRSSTHKGRSTNDRSPLCTKNGTWSFSGTIFLTVPSVNSLAAQSICTLLDDKACKLAKGDMHDYSYSMTVLEHWHRLRVTACRVKTNCTSVGWQGRALLWQKFSRGSIRLQWLVWSQWPRVGSWVLYDPDRH